jgi:eukaryotic-like serine/threonine-protein kinase
MFLRRFKTEAVITRKLQHPNAVRVDDFDTTDDGRPFIVMEYVEGENLRAVIQGQGRLPVPRALSIARQTASALSAAHALGITHRDIKPDNILLVPKSDGSDLVKVLDFGIAKVREGSFDVGEGYTPTQTGMVVGTPQYISPEQALGKRGDEVDGRADLYSLGVVLYEMLTGELPFHSDTPMGLILHHIQTLPRAPNELKPDLMLPAGLSELLLKALEKDPNRRFGTADQMVHALDALQAPGTAVRPMPTLELPPTLAQPPSLTPRPTLERDGATRVLGAPRGTPWLLFLLGGVAALALVGLFVKARQNSRAEPRDEDARIAGEVRGALASDLLKQDNVRASVRNGVVTLSGRANFQSDSDIAESLAGGVRGVKHVTNEIRVGTPTPSPLPLPTPPPPTPPPTPPSTLPPPVRPSPRSFETPPPPTPQPERHNWGALAYSELTGKTGTSSNFPSREAAVREALRTCGAPDCRPRGAFVDACGAFALAQNARMGSGLGPTRELAQSKAIDTCAHHGGRNCRVVVVSCNPHSP